jgi:hypothetical protein
MLTQEIRALKLEYGRTRPAFEYFMESAADLVIAQPEPGTA